MSALGDSFDFLGDHLADPYSFYARARKEEPVFYSPRMKSWVVTRYDDIFAVLRNNVTFSNANAIRTISDPPPPVFQEFMALGYPPTPNAITADGELHRRMRAPFARNFAADRVTAAEPIMRARVEACIDAIIGDGHAELMEALIRPLPIAVITHMYEVEAINEEMVKASTRGLLALQGNLMKLDTVEQQVQSVRAFVDMCRLMKRVVDERRANPRENDLVSMFVQAMVPPGEPMTIEQESMIVFTLAGSLLPGHETTAPQLGTGIWHLLEHRGQWELLCERPELIPQAVEEFCRYDASVTGMFRLVKEEANVGGQKLAAGDEVFLALPSANRDEAFCERPEVFDITRKPTKHLAFGYGAHYCIGAETGRREMRIALEILTRRLPGLRLPDRPVEIEPIFVTRGPHELHVEW